MRKLEVSCIALCLGIAMLAFKEKADHPGDGIIKVETPSRVVHIPLYMLASKQDGEKLRGNLGALAATPGGTDEPPRGPESFDVLEDGGFVVTDPLQDRLVLYDSLGRYSKALQIGLSASSVSFVRGGTLEVWEASTGHFFQLDQRGGRKSIESTEVHKRVAFEHGVSRMTGANRGIITDRPHRVKSIGDTLRVDFDSDSTQMVSLQSLGVDREGYTYVQVEAAVAGKEIEIKNIIRKYSPDGRMACQIVDIPSGYYVTPTDAFRVRWGKVYQFLPRESEVRINVWDISLMR